MCYRYKMSLVACNTDRIEKTINKHSQPAELELVINCEKPGKEEIRKAINS